MRTLGYFCVPEVIPGYQLGLPVYPVYPGYTGTVQYQTATATATAAAAAAATATATACGCGRVEDFGFCPLRIELEKQDFPTSWDLTGQKIQGLGL